MQNIEHMKEVDQVQHSDDQTSLNEHRTVKKTREDRDDRFVLPKTRSSLKSTIKKRERKDSQDSYQSYLSDALFSNDDEESVRHFTLNKTVSKQKKSKLDLKIKLLRNQQTSPFRKFKVLGWKDNYYTNLLDWSYNNFICAGYLNDLCLYNMAIDDQFESSLYRKYSIGLSGEYLTSLKCSPFQTKIALGYSNGSFKIFDYFKQKSIYNGYHHIQRIGAIEWSSDLILTGSKDQYLRSFDPRTKKPQDLPYNMQKAHSQQICGVKQRGRYVSTGGNDNKVNIYDIRKQHVVQNYFHGAAVKAMVWISDKCLVTGGGTADKKLKFWTQGAGVHKQIDTGSQICSLSWSPSTNEIVSCQGFSLNQIIIWNKKGQRQFTFHGHSSRVLYSALSPNGECLASGAGDQYLKIWKLFPPKHNQQTLLNQELR